MTDKPNRKQRRAARTRVEKILRQRAWRAYLREVCRG